MRGLSKLIYSILAVSALVGLPAHAQSRDQIRMVGSSTVFPFATAAAEEFGLTSRFKTPIVESTGSGGGLKLFCNGVGVRYPDMANSSRRIKQSEVDLCARNGVEEIIELKIGYDGIAFAYRKTDQPIRFTLKELYLALAKQVPRPGTKGGAGNLIDNPYTRWSEIRSDLPDLEIEVLGPPPTSGTRDAFNELVIEKGCASFEGNAHLEEEDEAAFKRACFSLREDGRFIEAGENDNLIVQKLQSNPDAFGIFGFSSLEQNAEIIDAALLAKNEGAEFQAPTFQNIATGRYPVSRPLYIYIKKAHIGAIPGIREFLTELTAEGTWGEFGYLTDKGMIPMPEPERDDFRQAIDQLRPLQLDEDNSR